MNTEYCHRCDEEFPEKSGEWAHDNFYCAKCYDWLLSQPPPEPEDDDDLIHAALYEAHVDPRRITGDAANNDK